jgi:hypothetical protein
MAVIWDVVLCSLVELAGVSEVHEASIITVLIKVASTPKTSVRLCQARWHNIPEDRYLHICHRQNLKAHLIRNFLTS